MKEYLSNNVRKLPEARGKGVEGTVYVQYTINEKGKVVDPLVVKSTNDLFNEAAIDMIKNMPDWTPGIQRGKKVSVKFTTPIRFVPAGG
jgi:protein TonB